MTLAWNLCVAALLPGCGLLVIYTLSTSETGVLGLDDTLDDAGVALRRFAFWGEKSLYYAVSQ